MAQPVVGIVTRTKNRRVLLNAVVGAPAEPTPHATRRESLDRSHREAGALAVLRGRRRPSLRAGHNLRGSGIS